MNNNIITITEEPSIVVTVPVNAVQVDLVTDAGITVYVPLATRTSPGIVKIGDGLLINPTTGLLSLDTDEITLLGVKVNGTALIPDEDKYVDVIVPTKTSDLTNDGDGEGSPYATQEYVWNYGGAVNGLILNDVIQTIDQNKMIIVNIDKTTVGLGNVDNTSDADKPISTAVNDALTTLQGNVDAKLDQSKADTNVMTNLTSSVSNDNVTLTRSFINLKTQTISTSTFSLPLATDETGGLMSSADYVQIRNNTSRIEQLEGQTKRLLYTDKTNPTAQEINTFVTDLGYTSPFSGIAVVVDQTFHIWHYYTNTSSWEDDGIDTVSQFTNSSPGVILGSATAGKVYAENDGTGSVYGWDNLTNRVSDLESNMPTRTSDLINDGDGLSYDVVNGYDAFVSTDDYVGYYVIISDAYVKVTEDNKDSLDITAGTTIAYEYSPFATKNYVAINGGKIDSISVNNVAQTIDANKNVNITVPTDYVDLSSAQNVSGTKTFLSQLRVKRPADDGGYFYVSPDGNGYNVKVGFSSGGEMMIHNGGFQVNRSLYPTSSSTNIDLGTSSVEWRDLYLKGKVNFGDGATVTKDSSNRINLNYNDDAKVKVGSAEVTFKNRLGADSDNSQDIGGSTVRWKDLYLAGDLTDGTNSISIANIANVNSIPTDYVSYNSQALTDAQKAQARQNIGAGSASATTVIVNSVAQSSVLFDSDPQTQITANANAILDIQALIPVQASTNNQLADKSFVNSSIATNTANFIGTFASVSELEAYSGTITNNDYAFVINGIVEDNGSDWATFNDLDAYDKTLLTDFDYAWVVNTTDNTKFDLYRFDIVNQEWVLRVSQTDKASVTLNTAYNRYKYSSIDSSWDYEYTLNNSSFTAAQWGAINSGVTSTAVAQIATNTSNIANKMDKADPTGSGSLSLNRKASTTVGTNSVAEGYNGTASGTYSHSEGDRTTASGNNGSHAEGSQTTASGNQSHAEGLNTTASESASHAEGYATTASGYYSHAEGDRTIAKNRSQHVFGEYNIADPSIYDGLIRGDYIEIVGNGDSILRSNARTLDWSGNEWLAGKLTPAGGLSDGNNANYKLLLPNTTNWTANKTIATTDQVSSSIIRRWS